MLSIRALLLTLALLLASLSQSPAAVIYWQGDSFTDPTDWLRAENWDLNRIPTTGDHVLIHRVTGSTLGMPVVRTRLGGYSYVTPSWHDVDSSVEIATGGRIDTYAFYLGYGAGAASMGRLIMSGGELYTRWLQVGNGGNGNIQLNAGTIRVALDISFGQELNGGTGHIEVRGGRLIFAGDCLSKLQNAIAQGWITAYDGAGRPLADFDQSISGHTVLWAVPSVKSAWGATPAPQGTVSADQLGSTTLAWQAGNGAIAHDFYFGSSSAVVAAATRNTRGIYRGQFTQPRAALSNLTAGATYYWRVDEVDANGAVTQGETWPFSMAVPDRGDLMTDTWVATDGIGRSLPGRAECGGPRADRTVGIYYVQWFGYHGTAGPYNATTTIAANPSSPNWLNDAYWWDEPEMGYFLSDDRWMIRRDIAMLTAAGVDVVIFEATNGFPYTGAAVTFLNELEKMEQEGYHTSLKFCFWTNAGSPSVVTTYYDALYAQGVFKDRWFYWKGKPLMLGYPDGLSTDNPRISVSQEIRDFFNWRSAWAWDAGQYKWQFVDFSPQDYAWAESSDRPEQVVVSPASHPTNNIGKSQVNGIQPTLTEYDLPVAGTEGQGLQFAEQSTRARLLDPEFLWLTEWNEWIATCFTRDENTGTIYFTGEYVPLGGKFFVDQYNREYNRDLAPMKGGYTDNYYYQMIDTIRRYKGVRPLPTAGGAASATIDGNFAEWRDVAPVFRDFPGDTAPRYHLGWGLAGMLSNTAGRNDIVEARVARDATRLYFYVRTREPLTPRTGSNWMLLFIDSDQDKQSGWQGYDYAVNLGGVTATTTTLRRSGGDWAWNLIDSTIPIRYSGNEMELSIPRSALQQGNGDDPVALDFHWADNITASGDIADFFVQGDSAPDRRFNYRYQTAPQATTLLVDQDWESPTATPWGDWTISTDAAYSGTHSLRCTRDNNAGTLVSLDTSGYQSFRLSFRYKLQNVWSAYPVTLWYHDGTAWNQIATLTNNTPSGAWVQYVDVRFNAGSDAKFFRNGFAFHIQGDSLTGVSQAVYVDDVKLEAIGGNGAATQPYPPNGATGVSTAVALGWTAGSGATSHRVYFGGTSPGTLRGDVTDIEQYQPPAALEPNTTYYWRIDELGASSTTTGTVWSFTTAPAGPDSGVTMDWTAY